MDNFIKSMKCPHCQENFSGDVSFEDLEKDKDGIWWLEKMRCSKSECDRLILILCCSNLKILLNSVDNVCQERKDRIVEFLQEQEDVNPDFVDDRNQYDYDEESLTGLEEYRKKIRNEIRQEGIVNIRYSNSGLLKAILGKSEANRVLVHPKANRRYVPSEVPKDIAEDFKKACLILSDCPEGSAAMSRRCLQHIIHDYFEINHGNLYKKLF